jgi:hypothetical protein
MGQEIVHCSVCGIRLRSSDFDRGQALRVDHTCYCSKCTPQVIPPPSHPPPSGTTKKRKNSTTRIPVVTPRHAMDAVAQQPFPPALLWAGAGLLVGLLAAASLMIFRTRTPSPSPPATLAPESPRGEPPPSEEKAKSAAKEQRPGGGAAPALSTEPAELAALDRSIADAAAQEKFKEALDLLTEAKTRHDTLEWTAAIKGRLNELENTVKALYLDLQERIENARRRGAEAEAKSILERIARWDMPGYGAGLGRPVVRPGPDATPAPPAPAPAPAPVPAAQKPDLLPFSQGLMKWALLAPMKMSAVSGATLTLLEDGSILAGGAIPNQEKYTLAFQTDLKGITAFRLEVLPDRSLPASGPGRATNGNIVLTEFRVQLLSDPEAEFGIPVAFEKSSSDFAQENFPAALAIDGKNDTGWALHPSLGRMHEAVFEAKAPLAAAGPITLLVVLDHQSIYNQHVIGRFRISASTVKNASQEFSLRPPPVVDQARVDEAIRRGTAWLRTPPYPADYPWSANELILWTWVHAGVPETDLDFQKRLKQMLDGPLDKTYRVALQAMILEELDRVAYQHRIWQCAQFLVDNQCLNGQWLYGTPVELPKGVPTPARAPVPTVAKLDADARRIKPKIVRKMLVRKSRDGPAEGDNSNSQYAALGLRACFDAGILIPEETVHRAMKWWLESQYFDERKEGEYAAKGWSYTSAAKEARATHTMTAGGISSLTIFDYMLGRDWKKSAVIRPGVNWIGQSFVISGNYYYLYGIERAGILYGTEKFGRQVWYPLGAQWILDHQDASGGWITNPSDKPDEYVWNTWNTCFAILFLRHATRPLVASEDPKR